MRRITRWLRTPRTLRGTRSRHYKTKKRQNRHRAVFFHLSVLSNLCCRPLLLGTSPSRHHRHYRHRNSALTTREQKNPSPPIYFSPLWKRQKYQSKRTRWTSRYKYAHQNFDPNFAECRRKCPNHSRSFKLKYCYVCASFTFDILYKTANFLSQ